MTVSRSGGPLGTIAFPRQPGGLADPIRCDHMTAGQRGGQMPCVTLLGHRDAQCQAVSHRVDQFADLVTRADHGLRRAVGRGCGSAGRSGRTPTLRRPPGRHRLNTGADTEATPGLALGHACRPAAPAHRRERCGTESRASFSRSRPTAFWVGSQASNTCAADPGGHRQVGADRHGVAQAAGALGRRDAAPGSSRPPAIQLRAFVGFLGQLARSRIGPAARRSESFPADPASSASRGPSANRPSASRSTYRWILERNREPVRRRPRQARCDRRARRVTPVRRRGRRG